MSDGDTGDRQPDNLLQRQEQNGFFLERLMLTRRNADRLFLEVFGLTAYPYLDILLVGWANRNRITVRCVMDQLQFSVELANRYLAIMVDRKMVKIDGIGFPIRKKGQAALDAIFKSDRADHFSILE
ncbi:hypothetical protein A8B75_19385 [Sphingomonadales bacterium EhC05]|jgi:hypothetical protein|uniref:hypothetical protein n=1 Tax=Parasphingorhabdus sp. TaxID=2709688 RepID=UPI0007F472C7|nr:hypothetical protein A8B75_19385 [Sphingomonadales bacterium EhC05]